jgi:hypothetical protein
LKRLTQVNRSRSQLAIKKKGRSSDRRASWLSRLQPGGSRDARNSRRTVRAGQCCPRGRNYPAGCIPEDARTCSGARQQHPARRARQWRVSCDAGAQF